MFFHVVMMRFTPDADANVHARIRDFVSRVRHEPEYARSYYFGRNIAERAKGNEWAVIGTFASSAEHDRYQESSVHQEMKALMMPYIADLVVCDVEVPPAPQIAGEDQHAAA
jgi:quinol monooxygenase YgiN